MIRGLYTAVSGMITLENKQNTITNNMANANTTGYKKQDLAIKSFPEVLISNKEKLVAGQNVKNTIGSMSLGAGIDTVNTVFTQGVLKETNRQGDFAINGRGFFVIQKGNQRFYTRDGNFRVNTDGTLINNAGDTVLGINNRTGAMEPIFVGAEDFTVDSENNLIVGNNATYKLALADFEDYSTLTNVGDNYYTGDNPIYNATVSVHQGALENSNVSITDSMVEMLSVMRSFETSQKMVNMIDESLSKAANEVGAVK